MDRIDELMDRASEALAATGYFEAERECVRAMDLALRTADFERLARLVLPLQEARRQIRLAAADSGRAGVIRSREELAGHPLTGLFVLEPPLTARDAWEQRQRSRESSCASVYLAMTPDGRGVSAWGPRGEIRAALPGDGPPTPGTSEFEAWFLSALEALSRAAVRGAVGAPLERVRSLAAALEAHPEDEAAHQALGAAAREAASAT